MKLVRECHAFDFLFTQKGRHFYIQIELFATTYWLQSKAQIRALALALVLVWLSVLYRTDMDIGHKNTVINIQQK